MHHNKLHKLIRTIRGKTINNNVYASISNDAFRCKNSAYVWNRSVTDILMDIKKNGNNTGRKMYTGCVSVWVHRPRNNRNWHYWNGFLTATSCIVIIFLIFVRKIVIWILLFAIQYSSKRFKFETKPPATFSIWISRNRFQITIEIYHRSILLSFVCFRFFLFRRSLSNCLFFATFLIYILSLFFLFSSTFFIFSASVYNILILCLFVCRLLFFQTHLGTQVS